MSVSILYGYHACAAAWRNPSRVIKALYLAEGKGEDWSCPAHIKRPSARLVGREGVDRVCPKGAVHQGVAMEVEALPEADVSDFLALPAPATVLLLDQVTDPHNVGAILRSAAAFGAAGMIMQRRHAPELTGALAKAASGAVECVPVATAVNLTRALEHLKDGGFTAIGLDERGQDIRNITPADKKVLVLGAEGPGIRRLVREGCDILARLPTGGPVATLNVSNAAAVALFALSRQSA